MNTDIKVNKSNKSITFVNNGIAFSQFGIADEILDLITNLQERCEYLQRSCERKEDEILSLRDECVDGEMYKSRIDKATNEIQYIIDYEFDYDGFNNVDDLKGLIDMLVDYARKSINILEGDDKE